MEAKLPRCSILEEGEPGDSARNGTPKKSWFGVVRAARLTPTVPPLRTQHEHPIPDVLLTSWVGFVINGELEHVGERLTKRVKQ